MKNKKILQNSKYVQVFLYQYTLERRLEEDVILHVHFTMSNIWETGITYASGTSGFTHGFLANFVRLIILLCVLCVFIIYLHVLEKDMEENE